MPLSDPDAELDAIAVELYCLPPGAFTAARNARAGSADRSIAAQITSLRKPTAAAWAVNLLVRGGQLSEAVELSAALREAQDDLDAAELAQLGRQRRSLVAALAARAVALAADAGTALGAAAREDVEKTINAAIVDAAAATAVLTGRLVRPVEAGAFDEEALPDIVGGSLPGIAPAVPRDDLAQRRARKAAQKAAREAGRQENEAARELARVDARRTKAQERLDHLRERVDDLRGELARFQADADAAHRALEEIEDERRAAARAAQSASTAAERARAAIED